MKNDNKEKELVSQIKEDFEKRRLARKSFELQWRLNMNFLMGNQYSEISARGDVEDYGKQYFWQQREVYNHISAVLETRLAKLSSIKVGMSVRPLTSDDSDKFAAKFSTRILDAIFAENNLATLINEANMWSETTGTVIYKINWDNTKGKLLGKDKRGNCVYEGDIDIEVCPPFEIYPDNVTNRHLEDCQSVIHAKAYSVSQIKDLWDVDVGGESINVFSLDSSPTLGGLGYSGCAQGMVHEIRDNHALVIEKYELPTKEYPNGRLLIVAGDKLVFDGDLPYINGTNEKRGYPFAKQCSIIVPGCFFGSSVVERIIPVQRAYNAIKNKKHEYLNRIAMGVLAVEDGSLDIENLEEEGLSPGKILIFRQGSKMPSMLELGSVPNDLIREEEELFNEFTTISGVSDLMKYTQTPDTNTSGAAISLLMEQDDSRMGMTAHEIRMAVKTVAQQTLRLMKQFAIAKRMKRLSGDNGELELKYFSSNDISSDDVVYNSETDILESASSRKNMALEMLKLGILSDEDGKLSSANKLKLMEMLGFGNWESGRELDELHIKKAKLENEKMRNCEAQPEDFDNHELHIYEHTRTLLSGEFEYNEDMKKRINEHIRMHRKMKRIEMELSDVQTNN